MAKWITFIEKDYPERKTRVFHVLTKDGGILLGVISWFGRFRKYSFHPLDDRVFESTCLRDIAGFMDDLMEERKKERENKKLVVNQ